VHQRHWDVRGRVHLHFPQIVIDPGCEGSLMPDMPPRGHTYWWTDRDTGDPVAMLLAAGWTTYTDYREGR
jgi:hypothetical protein